MIDPLYRAVHHLEPHIADATDAQLVAGNLSLLRQLVRKRRDYEAEMSPLALRLVDTSIVATVLALRRAGGADLARIALAKVHLRPVRVRVAS